MASFNKKMTKIMSKEQSEIDIVCSLLSYSIVYKFWESDDREGRGYNVGAVLVGPENDILDWDINRVNVTENSTQHGEVRLISSYLDKEDIYSLEGFTIYPTLEPCAMCAGMMTMTSVSRSVNGQRDYDFSKALERLAFDSEPFGGYPPYPRTVHSQPTPSEIGAMLDRAYLKYIEEGYPQIITKFLSTNKAKEIFATASEQFLKYEVKLQQNEQIYQQAADLLSKAVLNKK